MACRIKFIALFHTLDWIDFNSTDGFEKCRFLCDTFHSPTTRFIFYSWFMKNSKQQAHSSTSGTKQNNLNLLWILAHFLASITFGSNVTYFAYRSESKNVQNNVENVWVCKIKQAHQIPVSWLISSTNKIIFHIRAIFIMKWCHFAFPHPSPHPSPHPLLSSSPWLLHFPSRFTRICWSSNSQRHSF